MSQLRVMKKKNMISVHKYGKKIGFYKTDFLDNERRLSQKKKTENICNYPLDSWISLATL